MISKQRRVILGISLFLISLILFFTRRNSRNSDSGQESLKVVLVFTTYTSLEDPYIQKIIANRQQYATFHHYGFHVEKINAVARSRDPIHARDSTGWARLDVLRSVMDAMPHAEWFWLMDEHALILDPFFSVYDELIQPEKLDSLILRDTPVIPPQGNIRTPEDMDGESVHVILSHDHVGLNTNSFIVKNSKFGAYFLEAWQQPLYRSYASFERHETSALEHMLQWHYTMLRKTALIPKRLLSSYAGAVNDMAYKDGDFVVMFEGCTTQGRSCARELDRYYPARLRTPAEAAAEHGSELPLEDQ